MGLTTFTDNQKSVILELNRRRNELSANQLAVLNELNRRIGADTLRTQPTAPRVPEGEGAMPPTEGGALQPPSGLFRGGPGGGLMEALKEQFGSVGRLAELAGRATGIIPAAEAFAGAVEAPLQATLRGVEAGVEGKPIISEVLKGLAEPFKPGAFGTTLLPEELKPQLRRAEDILVKTGVPELGKLEFKNIRGEEREVTGREVLGFAIDVLFPGATGITGTKGLLAVRRESQLLDKTLRELTEREQKALSRKIKNEVSALKRIGKTQAGIAAEKSRQTLSQKLGREQLEQARTQMQLAAIEKLERVPKRPKAEEPQIVSKRAVQERELKEIIGRAEARLGKLPEEPKILPKKKPLAKVRKELAIEPTKKPLKQVKEELRIEPKKKTKEQVRQELGLAPKEITILKPKEDFEAKNIKTAKIYSRPAEKQEKLETFFSEFAKQKPVQPIIAKTEKGNQIKIAKEGNNTITTNSETSSRIGNSEEIRPDFEIPKGKTKNLDEEEFMVGFLPNIHKVVRSIDMQDIVQIPKTKFGRFITSTAGEKIVKDYKEGIMRFWDDILPETQAINKLAKFFTKEFRRPSELLAAQKQLKLDMAKGQAQATELASRLRFDAEGKPRSPNTQKKLLAEITSRELRTKELEPLVKPVVEAFEQQSLALFDLGLLKEAQFNKYFGIYAPRLYRFFEREVPLVKKLTGNKYKLALARLRKRNELLPESVRKELGEITEAPYPVLVGLLDGSKNIALGRFFKTIKKSLGSNKPLPGYVRVKKNEVLGVIGDGKTWVHPSIAEELQTLIRIPSDAERIGRKWLTKWKIGKTALNPATHGRNIGSNIMLADLAGLSIVNPNTLRIYRRAIKEFKTKGRNWQEANELGLFRTNYTRAELSDYLETADRSLKTSKDMIDFGGNMPGKFKTTIKHPLRALKKLYGLEDDFFKQAVYLYARDVLKLSPSESVNYAHKYVFDYTDVPPIIDWMRRSPFGVPFISWTYKAIPLTSQTLVEHPIRMAKWWGLLGGATVFAANKLGKSKEEIISEEKLLPERAQPINFFGIRFPKYLLLPHLDGKGRQIYLDLTYVLPFGDIGEVSRESGFLRTLTPQNPVFNMLKDLMTGQDGFSGRRIYPATQNLYEAITDPISRWSVTDYIYKALLPSWAPPIPPVTTGGFTAEKVTAAIREKPRTSKGEVPTKTEAIASAFGARLEAFDIALEGQKRIERYKIFRQKKQSEMTLAIKDRSIKTEDKINIITIRAQQQYKEYANLVNTIQGLQDDKLRKQLLAEVLPLKPKTPTEFVRSKLTKRFLERLEPKFKKEIMKSLREIRKNISDLEQ